MLKYQELIDGRLLASVREIGLNDSAHRLSSVCKEAGKSPLAASCKARVEGTGAGIDASESVSIFGKKVAVGGPELVRPEPVRVRVGQEVSNGHLRQTCLNYIRSVQAGVTCQSQSRRMSGTEYSPIQTIGAEDALLRAHQLITLVRLGSQTEAELVCCTRQTGLGAELLLDRLDAAS